MKIRLQLYLTIHHLFLNKVNIVFNIYIYIYLSRSGLDSVRSRRYLTKSWLDPNEFNQICLDLNLGNKPETDRYHTIPNETQSGRSDVSSESIASYDFPHPKLSVRLQVGHKPYPCTTLVLIMPCIKIFIMVFEPSIGR